MQFTDPTPTFYWYAKRAKLIFFKYASTKCNIIKTIFLYLTVSTTQCITYRPDLHNSQASRKKPKK